MTLTKEQKALGINVVCWKADHRDAFTRGEISAHELNAKLLAEDEKLLAAGLEIVNTKYSVRVVACE